MRPSDIDIFQAQLGETIAEKRMEAHAKHGSKSIEEVGDFDRLNTILGEEVGEVALAINDAVVNGTSDEFRAEEVRRELIDVVTVASAWIHRIERDFPGLKYH